MTTSGPAPTESGIRKWLAERLAERLEVASSEIGSGVPLEQYGLDSMAAFTLRGAIQDEFGIMLDLAAARKYGTLDELAGHLYEELHQAPPAPGGSR
jgi:acyl carrier protein